MPVLLALLARSQNVTKTSLTCMLLIAALPALEPDRVLVAGKIHQASRRKQEYWYHCHSCHYGPRGAQPSLKHDLLLLAVMLTFCARGGATSVSGRRHHAKLQVAKPSRGAARWVHVPLYLQSG